MQYLTLGHFYNADDSRLRSREHDYGLWWRDATGGPLHRAAWVCDTGELYIAQLGPGDGVVRVLAVLDDRADVERALAGWPEECPRPGSLDWLLERAASVNGAPRRSPASAAAQMLAPVGAGSAGGKA